MKRFTALILSLIMVFSLCACGVNTGNTEKEPVFTQQEPVTLSDGSTIYSREPFVDFPQTGEYKETALLTNVPGQGVPLLLDMRDDGTIDYIFAGVEEKADFQTFSDSGAAYYTIAPDGTATEQDTKWMEDIDHYMAMTLETTQDPNGKWRFLFAADEGTILILGQYHNVVQRMNSNEYIDTLGGFLYSTLFKVVDGQVTIVPLQWEVELNSKALDLRTLYLSRIELENEQITLYKRDYLLSESWEDLFSVVYNMDGTVVSAKLYDQTYWRHYWDDTGIFVESMDYTHNAYFHYDNSNYFRGIYPNYSVYDSPYVEDFWKDQVAYDGYISKEWFLSLDFNPYDENDPLSYSLYYHGRGLDNIRAVTQGSGKDYCCWYDEAGTGLLMRYTYHPEGKIEPEVVTVWSLEACPELQAAIAQWNATHASPVFRNVTATEALEGTHQTVGNALTRLNLELLNNQGPDVLILDGLNVDNYLEFMVPLDMDAIGGIYESIRSRFTVGDDLLAVPFRVSPYLLGRAAEETVEITSLQQFADMVEDTTNVLSVRNGRNAYDFMTAPYKVDEYIQLFQQWYPAWADAIWEGGKLNKEVFVEFLTQTTRLVDIYGLTSVNFFLGAPDSRLNGLADYPYLQITDGTMAVANDITYPYTLAAPNHVGLYSYWRYANEGNENQKPDPHYLSGIPGPDGTGAMIPVTIVGVRAGGNEEAGKAFVELLLSRQMQLGKAWHYPGEADGYPVIWEYTQELLEHTEDYMNQEYAVQNDYEAVMNSLRTVVIDEFLYEKAFNAAQSCYRVGLRATPEEAAEDLYEATRIYLAELR